MKLGDRIAHVLAESPGLTATEIAKAVKRRKAEVLRTLETDGRFQRVAPGLERSRRAKSYALASERAGTVGNSRDQWPLGRFVRRIVRWAR